MPKLIALATAALLSAACLAPHAAAIEAGSAACKRELAATQQMMQESAALVDSGMKASGAERCKALSQHLDIAEKIRESFARCERPKTRAEAVRDADDVIEASNQAYQKWCPAAAGHGPRQGDDGNARHARAIAQAAGRRAPLR